MSTSSDRTIRDFGEQWTKYQDNSGYYGSAALFDDVFAPLLTAADLDGKRVADIGAGTGRFVNIFLEAGASLVVAVEPSAAFAVLKKNTQAGAARVTYLNVPGDRLPPDLELDYAFSIGVLHHIPEPRPVLVAARRAVKPGGMVCAWVYGAEGNRAYLTVLALLRAIFGWWPHRLLAAVVWMLYWPLLAYMSIARRVRVPLGDYLTRVVGRLDADKIRLVIYDQLKPAYAKYYTSDALRALFKEAGFDEMTLHHRHGYSWTICAKTPVPRVDA
jgi:SAM-dependent methyltransferase